MVITNLPLSEFVTLLNGSRFGPHRAPHLLEVYKAFIDAWDALALADVLGETSERYAMHHIQRTALMCIAMEIITQTALMCIAMEIITQEEFEALKPKVYYDQSTTLREKILVFLSEVQS